MLIYEEEGRDRLVASLDKAVEVLRALGNPKGETSAGVRYEFVPAVEFDGATVVMKDGVVAIHLRSDHYGDVVFRVAEADFRSAHGGGA